MSQSQHDTYLRDYRKVLTGRKPAVIVERRKSRKAWLKVATSARERAMPLVDIKTADSTGEKDHAVIVARSPRHVLDIQRVINAREQYSRDEYQQALGRLLGYSDDEIAEFQASRLSLECGCELCGGPTPESRLDTEARKRRTYPYA